MQMSTTPPITRLIELIKDKLPLYKVVGRDPSFFSGSELLLTGVKTFKGKKIVKDHTYTISMPRIYYHNHEHKMRIAWLAGGLQGVYDYLAPFLSEDSLIKLKYRMMHVSERKEARA